jgi:hypothetical protein
MANSLTGPLAASGALPSRTKKALTPLLARAWSQLP